MFNDQRDRRDSIIATVLVVIACAGVFWMRSKPAIPVGGAPVNQNVATFKLTEPLPQAHDGAREVIEKVYECVSDGKRTFGNRKCGSADAVMK
jgi:hypothetical protein